MILLSSVSTLGAATAPSPQTIEQDAHNIIEQTFQKVMNRRPDPGALVTYTPYLVSGEKDARWLESILRGSPEGVWIARQRQPLSFLSDLVHGDTAFGRTQKYLLGVALFALWLSVFLWAVGKRPQHAVAMLIFGVLVLRFFSASLDPFLNLWDERFHALVAKNLMMHPLMPTLFDDPVIDQGANPNWDMDHVWLHKQPLFLWQIASAFRLFGVNELALRLPSVLLSTLLVLLLYRIGTVAHSQRVGFIAAYLAGTWFFLGEMVSGLQGMEHNDIAFIAYITASLWAWSEYMVASRGKLAWALVIGLLSGLAILTKWLVGLLVFPVWVFALLVSHPSDLRAEIRRLILSLALTIIVAAPWQVYTLMVYPQEALHELTFNARHFTETVEGHGGTLWYHVDGISSLYGKLAPFVLVLGAYLLCRGGHQVVAPGLIVSALAVYIFFTFAKTKLPAFPLAACSAIFLCLAAVVDQLLHVVRRRARWPAVACGADVALLIVLGYLNLNLVTVEKKHTNIDPDNRYRRALIHNRAIFRELADSQPPGTVLFNVRGRHYVEAMFYTGYTAYNFLPSEKQVVDLSSINRSVAVFAADVMPTHLGNHPNIRILPQKLEGFR